MLDNATAWYERICRDVQANFPNVTIITHGYDYVIPDGGRWLGKPMEGRGITDPALQRKIVVEMVDQLNRALRRMTQSLARVAYVDCRGSVPSTGWFDELHPRNPGFSQVAERISHAIREIAGGRGIAPEGRTRAAPAAPALVKAEGEFRALHLGLNRIDPYHYAGWDGALRGCENDARAMSELAEASGFRSKILLNEDASREVLADGLRQAASGLKAGDFFLLTYSGHGGQIPDWNGDEEEIAGKRQPDSTLCLYDSQMIDDELFDLWTRFETGVRILFLPDSCHSGSVVRAVAPQPSVLHATDIADLRAARMSRPVELLPRCMPSAKAAEVVAQNEGFYRERSRAFDHVNERLVMSPVKTPMRASLISISACQDEETAFDGDDHGMFTAALLKTWDRGNFFGNYREFHRRISLEIGVSSQNPRLLELPPADPSFSRQRPFGGHVGADADWTQTATDAPPRTETGRSLDALLKGEGDEHDLPVPGARGPSGSRGAADQETVRRFSSFMAGATSLKHFSPEEFLFLGNGHYGSGRAHGLNGHPAEELWPNIVKTAEVLDELRAMIGAPIRILSAYRNGDYNKAIGGENHSMHMQFRACDIAADGVPASKVAEAVLRLRAANGFKGGVGRYPGFTHVDTRGVNADWVQNGRKAGPPPSFVQESADPHADLIREYAGPTFAQRGRKRGGRGAPSDESGLADLATAQGAVNGAGIISFDPAMSEATRKAVLYSTQFAQRAADARADAIQDRLTWWTVYGSALKAVGWVTQGSQFRRMETDAHKISVDSLALDAISALLVGPSQLTAITTILDSLRKAADGDRRIELLDLYSSVGDGGLFQLGAAQAEGPGVVTMALGAVQFQKLDQRKKIVFFGWGTEESEFWVAAERMTLNLDFYAGHAQETVESKLVDAADLIQTFEIKEAAH